MKPYGIRIEFAKANENGIQIIETQSPAFSWAISAAEDENVKAYRVSVSDDSGEIWSTGFVSASDQEARYTGAPFTAGEVYKVNVEIKDDREAISSASRLFCYGVVSEWTGKWLTDKENKNCAVLNFAKDFILEDDIESACLFVIGLGYHKAYINGENAFTDPMNPAYTEYENSAMYGVIPGAEKFLKKGENRIGITVASGWRNPEIVCYKLIGRVPEYAGRTVMSSILRIRLKNGSVKIIPADESWKCFYDAISYSDIFMGETYEAERRVIGWTKPGKALGENIDIEIVPAPSKRLSPQTLERIKEQEIYRPVSVSEIAKGVWAVDFGQNIAGAARLRIPEGIKKGEKIEIRQIEFLDEDGRLFLPQLRNAGAIDTYIASGDEKDLDAWQVEFTYHGFRYAEITGYPGVLTKDDICAVSLYTDVLKDTHFTCGSAIANAFSKIALQTEKANIHSVLTDCPQRDERMGWMNDATVRFEATPYLFDIGRLFPKVVRDIMSVQSADGSITCTAPFAFGNRPADPVCSSFLVAGWQSYLHTGNKEILEEAYPAFAAWDDYLESRSENGIVTYSYYGDWAGPAYACESDEGACSKVTPGILMSTGYHYYNCTLLEKIANAIGRNEDAARHRQNAARIRESFLNKWYDGETGRVGSGSQACQAFSLWLNILPEDGRKKAAALMVNDLRNNDYRFTTGNLCTRYLTEQLARYGYIDDAWKIFEREEYPSFGYMLQNEATTVWERFELKKNCGMNSHNHPMHASSYRFFYAYLLGAEPIQPAWKEFTVKPYIPSSLLSASGSIETPMGDIIVRWVKRYGEIHVYLTVPYGAKAKISLPWGENAEAGKGFHHWSHAL
ncbi:MAG: family 78 glycoside hydrolase catalytic domain [Clostridia bacterium]|nr:family 78 glycoside hydrolase catalytic domain [Clostridia bacterium]